jgi:hypothetical protein
MRFESRRGQNAKKNEKKKKTDLQFDKTYFFYSSFWAGLFGFVFQRLMWIPSWNASQWMTQHHIIEKNI